jgi:hypothetical protein
MYIAKYGEIETRDFWGVRVVRLGIGTIGGGIVGGGGGGRGVPILARSRSF